MRKRILWSLAVLLASLPMAAQSACTWEWLCNGEGQCKLMPVCDSVNETPGPRPEGATPPAVPPLAMRPYKIAGAGVGVSTTLTCEHIMRKGKSGRWYWHEACFCTDPRKKETQGPFANIVRCDSQP